MQMAGFLTVTDRIYYLIVSLRVVVLMFGFNLGLAYAALVFDRANELVFPIIGTFICLCAWLAVELQIRKENNVRR